MRSAGLLFLSSICASGRFDDLTKVQPGWFNKTERVAYEFVGQFVARHGKAPKPATLTKRLQLDLPKAKEPTSYYVERLRDRSTRTSVRDFYDKVAPLVADDSETDLGSKVLGLFHETLGPSLSQGLGASVLDYRNAGDLIWPDYRARALNQQGYVAKFGWPYLDRQSGGLSRGDMISLVARPGEGKSQLSLWFALKQWRQGRVPLVFPLEMRALQCEQRLVAMDAKLSLSGVRVSPEGLSSTGQKKMLKHFEELRKQPKPFFIVDGNLMNLSVADALTLARLVQPDVIIFDGAYLLRLPNRRPAPRYERIAEVAESIKQDVALNLNLPVFCTWQLNRDAAKRRRRKPRFETSSEPAPQLTDRIPTLEDIADSDAIGRVSSIVLAMLDDETPEDLDAKAATKSLYVVKGRDGERGQYRIRWQFQPCDFREVKTDLRRGERMML